MENNIDTEYIQQVLKGNTDAFAFLVKKYQKMVYTLAHKITGNKEEAEDVAQEVFIKCYRSLNRYNYQSAFSTWLYKITYNHSIDTLKKKNKQWGLSELKDDVNGEKISVFSFDEEIDLKVVQSTLKEAMKRLSAEDQVMITLYYYDEQPLKNIAEIIGIKENHAKIKLHRIRSRLHKFLESKKEIISILNLKA